jgi:hypothetical protein
MRILKGPYQIRHTENGRFLVWSGVSQEIYRTGPLPEADATALAEELNIDYLFDQLEANS